MTNVFSAFSGMRSSRADPALDVVDGGIGHALAGSQTDKQRCRDARARNHLQDGSRHVRASCILTAATTSLHTLASKSNCLSTSASSEWGRAILHREQHDLGTDNGLPDYSCQLVRVRKSVRAESLTSQRGSCPVMEAVALSGRW